jgi:NAD(P)-dependent dehydrogenase (short-subunit alcohol dehydrogenase family)
MQMQGKVALITGGAGGIGIATAKLLVKEGAKVALVDLKQDLLKKAVSEAGLSENDYLLIEADVSKEADVQKYVKATKDKFGKIDVFFNNAGIEGKADLIVNQTAENIDKVFNVNLKGVFYGLKHVLAVMIEQKSGSVINTASVAGAIGFPGLSPYVATKHAVIGLTKTAAKEVATAGVRVNSIGPAPINTRMMRDIEKDMAAGSEPEAVKQQFTQSIPMGRYGEASEIAQLVLFLASDSSKFITGSYYNIDGGMLA